ncbi:hypothetical protein QWY20_12900 [Alkalimonas sp. MEB108]|uniref:RiboL-PSP-HEPN domain-containing protein n=1 Tax=Alkalimonas cellulosilytica TaxID=3058395 RepID=A0ABU7J753_9GAMM|nr:hypothetical protein [Alkalimonas sp. MEB108]MEE2002354.1 hypothetical protein [Alkalimonas sp. MEB108]
MDEKSKEEVLERGKRFRKELDKIAMAIGHLVIRFNRLDRDLGEVIYLVVGSYKPHIREVFTASLSFAQKVDMLSALLLEKHKNDAKHLQTVKQKIKKIQEFEKQRNTIMHSWWGTEQFGDDEFISTKQRVRGGKGLVKNTIPADAEKIMHICSDIDNFLWLELCRLHTIENDES